MTDEEIKAKVRYDMEMAKKDPNYDPFYGDPFISPTPGQAIVNVTISIIMLSFCVVGFGLLIYLSACS